MGMNEEKGALSYLRVNHGVLERIDGAVIGETRWAVVQLP